MSPPPVRIQTPVSEPQAVYGHPNPQRPINMQNSNPFNSVL